MVVETYQGPPKHRWQHRTINMVLKQRGICLQHYASHPICQCRTVHGWGGGSHQVRYRHSDPSASTGICSTILLYVEYAIGSIRWQSSHGCRITKLNKKCLQRNGLTHKNLDTNAHFKHIIRLPYTLQNTCALVFINVGRLKLEGKTLMESACKL